ncbi:hypothetical protein DFAR_2210063 [Desulfarculales bacterium]
MEGLKELDFAGFTPYLAWLSPGQGNAAQLVRIMISRRSRRNFQNRPVPRPPGAGRPGGLPALGPSLS